ncbi:hypothetical protein [Burkholderia ubonensis]|nr:hypothetical protein [Burkholderia ubonensis]
MAVLSLSIAAVKGLACELAANKARPATSNLRQKVEKVGFNRNM